MTNDQARDVLFGCLTLVTQQISIELAKAPAGTQPALGDGTFLAQLMKLLELLLPLILKFFPT